MEIESGSAVPFMDVLVIRKEMTLATEVSRKSTHPGRYLRFNCDHLPHVKISLIYVIYERASTVFQEQ
jgi:hypothetical protein